MSGILRRDVDGWCCIVLHSHLPYVHHPDHEDFLEEDWLFEAMTETYLPLLYVMRKLAEEGTPFRLSFSLTPPLVAMLESPSLIRKFEVYLLRRLELARREIERLAVDPRRRECAEHYVRRYGQMLALFEDVHRDLPAAFRDLQDRGHIEILASAATHGFLPLLGGERAIRGQIGQGVADYERVFGRRPRGFWLPECAFRPGLEGLLRDHGIEWIVLESNGVRAALPAPPAETFRPITLGRGLVAFGRDPESSRQVWSSVVGYPGDPQYRELYRDLGFDLDYHLIRPFLKPDGVRRNVGIKYHRITGKVPLHEKDVYSPATAREQARVHAGNFIFNRTEQIRHWRHRIGEQCVVLSPYDTELFGHWWYEGPWFFESLFRQARDAGSGLPFCFATPSEVLDQGGSRPETWAHASSWGAGSFFRVWLNEKNEWMWRHIHEIEARFERSLDRLRLPSVDETRILKQMARELVLAESSDWPFILTMETTAYYAELRFRAHVHRFFTLADALDRGAGAPEELAHWEHQDAIAPDVDLSYWR